MGKLVGLISLIAFSLLGARAGATVIDDFEDGDLAGWTLFTTSLGTLGVGEPVVVSFDTNGDLITSNSARFHVGRTSTAATGPQGGGMFRTLNQAVDGVISLDVAAFQDSTSANNDAGLFELLIDSSVVDSFGVASDTCPRNDQILPDQIRRDTLSGSVTAGAHEIRIRMTRCFISNDTTPFQFIDNLRWEASISPPIPEPGTATLLLSGLIGLRFARRRS